jgi:hypothetical protein
LVTFVCDDDAFIPQALKLLDQSIAQHPGIQVVTWTCGSYCYDNWPIAADRNKLGIPEFTGAQQVVSSEKILDQFLNRFDIDGSKSYIPSIVRSAYHRDSIRLVTSKAGRLFIPYTPDYGAALAILAVTDRLLRLELPLVILGSTADSNVAGVLGAGDTRAQAIKEIADGPLANVPIKSKSLNRNWIADTALVVMSELPEYLAGYQFNWESYFKNCYQNIVALRSSGVHVDVSSEMQEFQEALSRQPPDIRREVGAYVETLERGLWRRSSYQFLKATIEKLRSLVCRAAVSDERKGVARTIDARTLGICDILQCSRYVGSQVAALVPNVSADFARKVYEHSPKH